MSDGEGDLDTPLDGIFVDLTGWRVLEVTGDDAIEWLNDLLTADMTLLEPNGAMRSLLLTPTGGIRADVTVADPGGALVIVQDPRQPEDIDYLLVPYILSSDVQLRDRSGEHCLFALPDAVDRPTWLAGSKIDHWAPSCLGPGVDLFGPAEEREELARGLAAESPIAPEGEIGDAMAPLAEAYRVRQGIPRFGVDALPGDLPQEAGLEGAVAFDKGCYLGQEAVAKVRNLGHPRRLVVHLRAPGRVTPGEPVMAGGEEVGTVTSAAPAGDGGAATLSLARIRWDARELPLTTAAGLDLLPVDRP